jgi:prepilin-type N-terminal cleavage/methylation domain-containing protein
MSHPAPTAQPGFSLIEVALAVAVGLMVLGATVYAFNQVNASSKVSNAKTIVGTIQGNIAMDKFRLGTPPPMTPKPGATPVYGISINTDYTGKPYYPQASPGALPIDPISGFNTVKSYNSAATPAPIAAGDPTPQWDNPVFQTPSTGATPGYGKGGWLYDEATGAFRINYSNKQYPEQRPGSW